MTRDMRFSEWLRIASREHNGPTITMMRKTEELYRQHHIQHVTSKLLTTDFLWQTNTFVIEILDRESSIEPNVLETTSPRWYGSSVILIGVLSTGFLAYSGHDGTVADILYIDRENPIFEVVEEWDMTPFWMRSAVSMGRIASRPIFGCAISPDESSALVIGPSPDPYSCWGCKVMDMTSKKFVQTIEIEEYKWAAAASFHTEPGHDRTVAMVSCRRYEYKENYSRPLTTGTLLLYNLDNQHVLATLKSKSVSTEVLRFSKDGRVIIVRLCGEKCLAILESHQLTILRTIPHDVSLFPSNHFTFRILYPMFPIFTNCDREFAMLDWSHTLDDCHTNSVKTEAQVCIHRVLETIRPLKNLCRNVILGSLKTMKDIESLQLPSAMKLFLQWKL